MSHRRDGHNLVRDSKNLATIEEDKIILKLALVAFLAKPESAPKLSCPLLCFCRIASAMYIIHLASPSYFIIIVILLSLRSPSYTANDDGTAKRVMATCPH